jgi:fructosamine-3-kinase
MSLTGRTSIVDLPDGTKAFRKALPDAPAGFFQFEATGLQTLRELGARVPQVYEVTDEHLNLELIPTEGSAHRKADTEYVFGQELARLHLAGQQAAGSDQTFGSLPGLSHWFLGGAAIDLNPTKTLYESLVTNRIVPLTRQAVDAGLLTSRDLALAESITPEHLGPSEPPTVVHGDLWAGNRLVDSSGVSWLTDPSCHWGHREQDIAMMHLFGGFGPDVMAGYQDEFPLADGWQERIPTYQLVPLLVHVLLFGSGYAASTRKALEATVAR